MDIINKQIFPLHNGNLFAVLEVRGKKEERIKLSEQGISGKVIFYREMPKHKWHGCVNCPDSGEIELGGSEEESERQLYVVVSEGSNEGRNNPSERH
jgi:hypothetical protein